MRDNFGRGIGGVNNRKTGGVGVMKLLTLLTIIFASVLAILITDFKDINKTAKAQGRNTISRVEVYHPNGQYKHQTGMPITLYAGLTVSEESGVLRGAKLQIEYDKEYLDMSRFEYSDIDNMLSKEFEETEDRLIVTYNLRDLTGGVSIDVPITVSHVEYYTPDGFVTNVRAKVLDSEGELVEESKEVEVIAEALNPNLRVELRDESDLFDRTLGVEDPNNKGYITTEDAGLATLNYGVRYNMGSRVTVDGISVNKGSRNINKVEIEMKLEEGVIMNEELTNTNLWKYDTEKNIATYTINYPNGYRTSSTNWLPEFHFKYPGAKIGDRMEVEITMKAYPVEPAEGEKEYVTTIRHSQRVEAYMIPDVGSYFQKGGGTYETSENSYRDSVYERNNTHNPNWSLYINNPYHRVTGYRIGNIRVEDRDLDENLEYTSIRLINDNNIDATRMVGNINIGVYYKDGTEELVVEDMPMRSIPRATFERSEDITGIYLETLEGAYIPSDMALRFEIITKFKKREDRILGENEESRYMNSYADFKADLQNREGETIAELKEENIKARKKLIPTDTRLQFRKSTTNGTRFLLGDVADYKLYINPIRIDKGDSIQNLKIFEIIPEGMEYVKGSSEIDFTRSTYLISDLKGQIDPQIVPNFRETGKTALVWEFGDVEVRDYNTGWQTGTDANIEYSLRVNSFSREGKNDTITMGVWGNNNYIYPYENVTIGDEWDLNDNGETDDKIARIINTINYVPPREIMANRKVKGSEDTKLLSPPAIGTSSEGDKVSFQLDLYNNSIVDFHNVTLLEIVPKKGDKKVVEDRATGKRELRGTTMDLMLEELVTPPECFEVLYTTEDVNEYEKSEDIIREDIWVSEEEIEDLREVTAIQYRLKEGSSLPRGDRRHFDVSYRIPEGQEYTEEDKAVSTVGVSLTNNYQFFESNESEVRIGFYNVNGMVFRDEDEDGYKSEDELGLRNLKVSLLDSFGNIARDREGKPYEAITDSSGRYRIDLEETGRYRVKVEVPRGFEFTTVPSDTRRELIPNDIDNNVTGTSNIFTIDLGTKNVTRNAGFKENENYLEWDGESKMTKRMQGDDGTPKPLDIYTNAGVYTRRDENGEVRFSGLQVNTSGLAETNEAPIALEPLEVKIEMLDENDNVIHKEKSNIDDNVYLFNDEYLSKIKLNKMIGESESVSRNYGVIPNITNITRGESTIYNVSDAIGGTDFVRKMAIGSLDVEMGEDEDRNYLGRWVHNSTDLRIWSPLGVLGTTTELTDVTKVNKVERVRVTIESNVYNILENTYEQRRGSDGKSYFEYVGTELQQGYYEYDEEGNVTGIIYNSDSSVTQITEIDVRDINLGKYINADGFREEGGEFKTVQNKVATEKFEDGGQTLINGNNVIEMGDSIYSSLYESMEEEDYESKPSEESLVVNYYEEFGYIPHQREEELVTQQAVPVGGIFYYLNPYDYTTIPSYASNRLGTLSGVDFTEPLRNYNNYNSSGVALSKVEYEKKDSGFYMSDVDEHEEFKGEFAATTLQNRSRMKGVLTEGNEVDNFNTSGSEAYKEYKDTNTGSGYLPVSEIQDSTRLKYRLPITHVHNIQEFLLEGVVAVGKDSGYPVISEPDYIEEDYRINYLQDNGVEPTETDKLITMNRGSIYLIPTNNKGQSIEDEYRTRLFVSNMGISQTSLVEDKTFTFQKYLYGRGDNTLYSGKREEVRTGYDFNQDQMIDSDKEPIEVDYVNGIRINADKELTNELLRKRAE